MAKKQTKKKTTKRPNILLKEFIETVDKEIFDVVIKNKIITDISSISIKRSRLTFINVKFAKYIDLTFPVDSFITFENCEFAESISISSTYIDFNKCTFKKNLRVFNCNDLDINNCIIKEDLTFVRSESITINDSTIKSLKAINCNNSYITGSNSNIRIINISQSNIKEFTLTNIESDTIKLVSSYFDNIYIINKSNKLIDTFTLFMTFVSGNMDITRQKFNKFIVYRSSIIEKCAFNPKNINTFNIQFSYGISPPTNEIILYKKVALYKNKTIFNSNIIAKLVVPADAKRVYCGLKKIRVSKAKCIGFYNLNGTEFNFTKDKNYRICSLHSENYEYEIDKICKPEKAFCGISGECGSGIHGFIDFNSAVKY